MSREAIERIDALERQVGALTARVAELEGRTVDAAAAATSSRPATSAPTGAAPPPPPFTGFPPPIAGPPAPPRPAVNLEDLLGARVLAWAGGAAVLLGVAFFVAVAIGRGWIDEPTRILLAFVGSVALLGTGVWLHDRHGQTQASLALVGTAVASLFMTLTAAVQLYELVPAGPALLLALAAGATATAVAVHLDSRAIAGLGIVGSLLAPVLVDAGTSNGSLAFMAVALCASVGVLLWRRWDWLAVATFVVSVPQVAAWSVETDSATALVLVLAAYGGLNLVAAIGYEVRVPGTAVRPSAALLVLANALAVTWVGYFELVELAGTASAGDALIAALAVAHFALGVAAVRSRRIARAMGVILVAAGVALGDLAFGLAASGPGLAAGWALAAVVLAWFAGRQVQDRRLLVAGVIAHITLPALHVMFLDAPLGDVVRGFHDQPGSVIALLALGLAALGCARLLGDAETTLARGLDSVAALSLAYLTAAGLDGAGLVTAWAIEGALCAVVARRTGNAVARVAGPGLLAVAALHALAVEAPADSLADGAPDLLAATVALLALAGCSATAALVVHGRERRVLESAAAVTLVYLGSVAIVSAFEPGGPTLGLGALDGRQQGQVLLSGFWSLTGLAALTVGLLRDVPRLRFGGLALLVLALLKVFVYDLQSLDSIYRVLSFVAIGLLLLAGAFAYQRLRPDGGGEPLAGTDAAATYGPPPSSG